MQIIAIIASALSNFLLGGLWYSPILFGTIWQKEQNLSFEQLKSHGVTPYIFSLIFSVLAAIGFNYLIMNSTSLYNNLIIGLIVGILLVATALGTNYQFAGRSNTTFLIDAGYHIARFVIYALIFWFINY